DSGVFRAVNARNGEVLWTFRTGSDFRGSPVSYLGPDGRQYIAVITSKAPSDPQIGEDTDADASGRYRRAGTTLYVCGLPCSTGRPAILNLVHLGHLAHSTVQD